MLQELYEILSKNELLKEKTLKNLEKSICNSNKLVIDFDYLKNEFCKRLKIPTLKSADALVMDITKSQLSFLELKDLKELVIRNEGKYTNEKSFLSFLKSKFEDFKIHDKIIDSNFLILVISGFYKIHSSSYSSFLDKNKVKINFLLVVNLFYQDYLKYRIPNLGSIKSYKFRFLNNFNILRCEDLSEIL
jgi:hypothetical protein